MENAFWIVVQVPVKLIPGAIQWMTGTHGQSLQEAFLDWTLFADNAPARSGRLSLVEDLNFAGKARDAIEAHPLKPLIYSYYGGPTRLP